MRTVNSIHIHAPLDEVFHLAADVERWPDFLPHYRWVRGIRRDDEAFVVEMAARRSWIPVKWTSVQKVSSSERWIRYEHIGGATKGMSVEWSFVPLDGGIDVTIVHDLTLTHRIVASRIGKWIVGRFFVEPIADQTLWYVKILAEGLSNGGTA